MNDVWRHAPRDVDLLSWFTGPLVPILFGGIATVTGVAVSLTTARDSRGLVLDGLAIGLMVLAFWMVSLLAPPRKLQREPMVIVASVGIGWASLLVSVASEWGSTIPFEVRWAPIGFGLLMASLAPCLSARRIIFIGALSTVVCMGTTALSVTAEQHPAYWPFFVQLFLGSTMILISTAGAAVFSYQAVARTMRWANTVAGDELSGSVLGEAARRRILQQELENVSARAIPLLERVTSSGIVTEADRKEATTLSESLRIELVERSNRSWLESLTQRLNLTVIDHERLAEQMSPSQRSALLGLLTAAAAEMTTPADRVVVELRGEADGATAVAISADNVLPDGRRLTLLAPYYVSLVASVNDVEWDPGDTLRLRFRILSQRTRSAKGLRRGHSRETPTEQDGSDASTQ